VEIVFKNLPDGNMSKLGVYIGRNEVIVNAKKLSIILASGLLFLRNGIARQNIG